MSQANTEQGGGADPIVVLSGRVDELGRRMENGFNRLDADLKEQAREMKAGFERIDERFDRINERFERMHRTMLIFAGMLIVALAGLPRL